MTKIKNKFLAIACMLLLLAFVSANAQQASGTHVSSYNFSQSSGVYSPISGGTLLQLSTTGLFPSGSSQAGFLMPFNFRFNGKLYTAADAFWIQSNGYITIKSGVTAPTVITTGPLSSTNVAFNYTDGGMISAATSTQVGNGTSLTGNTGTSTSFVRIGSVGTTPNRRFFIQWENVRRAAATTDSWNYQIVLNEDGGTLSNQIEFNYGSMTFGSATNVTKQVGLRGFVVNGDVQSRTCATGIGGWSASILGASNTGNSTANTNSMIFNSTTVGTTYPSSGLSYRFTPCSTSTPYATVPYSMDFEASWTDYGCGSSATKYAPGVNWKGGSLYGDASWRRQNEGATAGFRFLPTGLVVPSPSTGAANFHTYGTNNGAQGVLDLYIDLSGGPKNLTFNTTNASGTDILEVLLSTDGGLTFGSALGSYGVNASWAPQSLTLSGGTATSVIRFRATSDFGNDDIGLDDISVTVASTPPNCAVYVSPANGSSGLCPVIRWADGGGATSYDVYFGTATNPPLVQAGTTNTFYVPVGGYVNGQTYYWKIIPQNVNGPAVGCVEYSYTAGTLASCYCTPTSTNGGTGGDAITAISFATLNQTGNTAIGPPGYLDNTNVTVNVNQGSVYQAIFSQQDASDAVKVWLDFNDNGSFEDAGEMILQTGAGTTVLGNITIPIAAPIGNHRLRIRNAYTPSNAIASVTSCSAVVYGETRDFTVNIAASVNDASVTNVYSMGSLPKGYGDPHTVRARVYNGGASTMTSLNVTMNITGANSFSDVQTIASLAPGASTIVTFAGFNPTNNGINTITVSVPSDDVNGNNSSSWDQDVTANIYSYKNPLQANFGGVGFNAATGDFVGKFAASNNFGNSDTINEVQVEFTTTGQSYQIGIWAADGVGGIPGTLLYTSPTYTTATGGPQIKAIPNVVVSGDFYVGARQTGTTNIGFAYQAEIPIRNQTFYFTSPSGAGTWQDFSQPANPAANPFRFSIQVRFEVPQIPLCPTNLLPANASTSCQNGTTLSWNTGGGGTTSYDVYLSTVQSDVDNQLAGALVSDNQAGTSYNTGVLVAGQTYYWRVVGVNNYGESSGCSTQSFTTNLYSCYCTVASASSAFEHIGNVSYGAFSNTSTGTTYSSYTNLTAIGPAIKGQSFNLSVTVNNAYSTDVIYAFVDLNQDGDFSDANELAGSYAFTTGSGASPQTVLVPVSINASALSGETGFRIKMGDGDPLSTVPTDNDPCQTAFSFGEVEDYKINIDCGSATASSNSPVCSGQSLDLSSSWVGAGTPVSYVWSTSAANGFSSSGANPNVTASANSTNDNGTYTVTITDNTSCSATASVSVSVNPSPQPQIGGGNATEEVCQGLPLAFSANNLAGGQTSSYSWSSTAANGFTSSQQNVSVTASANPAQDNGTYTVFIQNQFLCTASASVIATVNPNPSATVQSTTGVGCSTLPICDGSMVVTASGGTTPYQLYDDGNGNLNGDGLFTGVMCFGPGTVTVTDDKGCLGTALYNIGAISTAPPTASVIVPPINNLPAFACNGTLVNNINVPLVAGATKYNWDGPTGTDFNGAGNNFTNSAPNANITFGGLAVGASGYYIGVQAANGCGTTLRKVQWVRGILSVPTVSGPSILCANGSGVFTVTNAPIGGAQTYTWSGPAGTTFNGNPTPYTSVNTSVTATMPVGFVSGSICVTANAACISTAPKCISVSTSPSALGSLSGVFSVCPPAVQNYQVSNPGAVGGTYNWTLPANASGSSTSDNINVTFAAGFTGGNISVTYTNTCGQTSPVRIKSITIGTPSVPSSITTTTTNGLCGQSATFSCPPQAGASFNWTFPSGSTPASIPSGSNSVASTMPGAPFSTGQVCVTATNGCGTSGPRCIGVKGAPLTPGIITPTPGSWCAPTSGIQFSGNISSLTGVYNLNWAITPATAATYVSGQGTNNYTVDWDNAGTATVILTASNACGNGSRTLSLNIASCSRQAGSEVVTTTGDNFSVYPNPASDLVQFEFNSISSQNVTINLTDLSGRVVLSKSIDASEGLNYGSFDVSKLAKGVYTFKATLSETTSTVRIVVE